MSDNTIPAPGGVSPVVVGRVAPSDPDAGSGQLYNGPQHYAPWTLEETERLRRVWPDASVLNDDLPVHFRRTLNSIRAKAQLMRLGKRPSQCDGKRRAAAQRRLLKQMSATHRHRIAALQDEMAAPVEQAAPGLRETERLIRARMLMQRGISVDSIVAGLKLTALECAALRGQA